MDDICRPRLLVYMPTILRIRDYRFYFYALEGTEPPPVHVDKGSGTIKLWLHDPAWKA